MAEITGRNIYIDFFRGLALWWIFVDHTPGDWLSKITFRSVSVSDAFELFVLLTGLSVGYAYGGTLFRRGQKAAAGKALRRAGVIYMANLILFCALFAEVALLRRSETGRSVLEIMDIDGLMNFTIENVSALLTFNYPSGFIDILPLYVVLFLGLAVALPLLRFPRVLLSLSVALYAATWLLDLHFHGRQPTGEIVPHYSYLNPLAWQVLLIIGAVVVIEPSLLPLPNPVWDIVAVAVVAAAFGMQALVYLAQHRYLVPSEQASRWGAVIAWMQDAASFDDARLDAKVNLHPSRLANILAWAWLAYRLAPFYGGWLRRRWAKPFILCGRHSLPVFLFGVALAPLGGLWLANWPGLRSQITYNVAGAVIMVCVAALAAAAKERRPERPAFPAAPGLPDEKRVGFPEQKYGSETGESRL